MSIYSVRPVTAKEIPALGEIERSAAVLFRNTPYAFLADTEPLDTHYIHQCCQAGRVWGAVDQGTGLVGFVLVDEVDGNCYLREIDVMPAHGCQGIGRRLVAVVCNWATEQGYGAIILSTFRDVPWNAPFYKTCGFRILEQSELTDGLQHIRQAEAAAGLPMQQRIIMRRELR